MCVEKKIVSTFLCDIRKGDPLYTGNMENSFGMSHQALHAKSLALSLPMKKVLTFEAELNNELKDLRNNLGKYEKKKVIE